MRGRGPPSRTLRRTRNHVTHSHHERRDGATDGTSLLFGNDIGIFVVDPTSLTPGVPVARATSVMAANGPQTLATNPISGPGLAILGNYRGVAYNPNGNGGNGSIWTANFGSDLLEIDLQGNVLQQFANQPAPDDWSVYGLAFDPNSGNLWANSAPNAGPLAEIDTTTGLLTGRIIPRIGGLTQGGLDIVPGGLDGRNCGADLIELGQGTPDTLTGYRLDLWDGYSYAQEPVLSIGVDGGALTTEAVNVLPTASTLDFDISATTPYCALINVDPQSSSLRPVGPIGPFKSLWEVRRTLDPVAVLNGMGGTVRSIPAGALPTDELRIQAIALDPAAINAPCGVHYGLIPTNEASWTRVDPPAGVLAEAVGANSFNVDTTSGFFSVTNNTTANMTEVTFTWVGSPNPTQASMEFDTDQGGMADAFWNGNAVSAGCAGTYRNNSDILTGLDYGNAGGLNLVSACAIAPENSGVEGSDAIGTVNDFQTLTWRFTDFGIGERFEFDCDTDGGAGTAGGQMDGMIVRVVLSDGRTSMGVLAADPLDPMRSSVIF